jgi:hypothetical protein
MSTTYFISPISPKEWEAGNWKTWEDINSNLVVQPDYLAAQIQSKWSNVELYWSTEKVDEVTPALTWHIPSDVSGKLQSNLNTIAFKRPHVFAEFVIWYRSIIHEEYKLFLSNDSSDDELQLTSQTTIDEVETWDRNH